MLGSDVDGNILPTGEVVSPFVDDSVLISIEDLKAANVKMIELRYEKAINKNLQEHISNDSVIISSLNERIDVADRRYKDSIKKVKKERTIYQASTLTALVLLILSLLK